MRGKLYQASLLLMLTVACLVSPARAQSPQTQDEEITVRGAFLTTRPSAAKKENKKTAPETIPVSNKISSVPVLSSNAPSGAKKSNAKSSVSAPSKKPARRDRKNAKGKPAAGDARTGAAAAGTEFGLASKSEAATPQRPIGLGYTLFTLGDNGQPLRTDPTREFRTGESVRLALETNTEGYLYIFHTEADGEPQMIFPDARLGGGNNLVHAHVPYEIPSSREAEESLRWFIFKEPAAGERLYVVLAREPLSDVPTGEALSSYCFDTQHTCPWQPLPAMWANLKLSEARDEVAVSRTKDEGLAQTADEREATARGLGLASSAPPPSIIRMTASANAPVLVTTIDLIHK